MIQEKQKIYRHKVIKTKEKVSQTGCKAGRNVSHSFRIFACFNPAANHEISKKSRMTTLIKLIILFF